MIRVVQVLVLLALFAERNAAGCPNPPGWWTGGKTEDLEFFYFRGESGKSSSLKQARLRAFEAALDEIRQRIAITLGTDASSLAGKIELPGADIAFQHENTCGTDYYAWVLVSYPRTAHQTALERLREARAAQVANGAEEESAPAERPSMLILPIAFASASREQFPEVVEQYSKKGYGNAIWQTLEDAIYDTDRFDIVSLPSEWLGNVVTAVDKNQPLQAATELELPKHALFCNMNFFSRVNEELKGFTAVRNTNHTVTLHLRYYDLQSNKRNIVVPVSESASGRDLSTATEEAARKAVQKLLKRIESRQKPR